MLFSTHEETFLEEIQGILPVSSATSRERLWPFIDQVERKFIRPLLEADLYAELDKFYNKNEQWSGGSGTDTDQYNELLRLVRVSSLNLSYFIGFDLLNTTLSDSGFQKAGDNDAFKGLYKYQEDNLRKYFEETGYNGLDDMLKFIEENIEYFSEWEESSIFIARKSAIIKDAETFDAVCSINKSRLTYLRLQRYMNEVLDFDIKPLLGDEYSTLVAELTKDEPAAKYTALVTEIKKPLAFLSCALLIERSGSLTNRGLFFEGKQSGFPNDTTITPAYGDAANLAAANYRIPGQKYLDALAQYLIDNEFTEAGTSGGYLFDRDNDDKKIFFA